MRRTELIKAVFLVVVAFMLAFAGLAFIAEQAEGSELPIVSWEKEKVVDIVGEVGQQMFDKANQVRALSGEPVIRIFINSPGGSVVAGNIFIQAMDVAKARGSRIECAVSNLAASMGIHILAHCDVRMVLSGGYLLFHEPRVGISSPASPSELRVVMEQLIAATDTLDKYLQEQLGVSYDLYNFHNVAQTLWQAEIFNTMFPKFGLVIVRDIRLSDEQKQGLFDPRGESNLMHNLPRDYIWEVSQ